MPSEKTIRNYWKDKIEFPFKEFYSVSEFMTVGLCFACGFSFKLERAHIKAKTEGGSDTADNLHMLCWVCHKDSEYLSGSEYWDWFNQRTIVDRMFSAGARKGINIYSEMIK